MGSLSSYRVRIRDTLTLDDDLHIDMGPCDASRAWHAIPLPPCPDCGGQIVGAEAGHVPETRRCTGCGSMFSIQVKDGNAYLRRARFHAS